MKLRIHVDAAAFGGREDDEFSKPCRRLRHRFARGDFLLVVFTLTIRELIHAPDKLRSPLASLPEEHIEPLPPDALARELADAYIAAGLITPHMQADAHPIAIAPVARAEVLASWDFEHIVNLDRIHGYNSVNLRRGYPPLEMRAPTEVLSGE